MAVKQLNFMQIMNFILNFQKVQMVKEWLSMDSLIQSLKNMELAKDGNWVNWANEMWLKRVLLC